MSQIPHTCNEQQAVTSLAGAAYRALHCFCLLSVIMKIKKAHIKFSLRFVGLHRWFLAWFTPSVSSENRNSPITTGPANLRQFLSQQTARGQRMARLVTKPCYFVNSNHGYYCHGTFLGDSPMAPDRISHEVNRENVLKSGPWPLASIPGPSKMNVGREGVTKHPPPITAPACCMITRVSCWKEKCSANLPHWGQNGNNKKGSLKTSILEN